ncbi:alpha/beta hydrolase [Flavivirga rizhaonensis]|uniref:alpha/beta hydrolase n=1 Tax=Flavivirga rizhaonensis TaxID=2559571 RepID=UPI001476F366|nr:alpha/beta fold hydrolase [Flavivirga rizhaonensis]
MLYSLSEGKNFDSNILNKILPYKVYLPPIDKINNNLPVIYINDGYNYINKGRLVDIIDSLIISKQIKPVVAIFLEPRNKKEKWKNIREELFLCNPSFVDFFTNEFISKMEQQYPINKNNRTIMGVSFGGLAVFYLADKAPDSFKNIVMQSPAFHPCPDIYESYTVKSKKNLKMYLSYGTGKDTEKQDIPMVEILRDKGYNLKVERVINGNHEWTYGKNKWMIY